MSQDTYLCTETVYHRQDGKPPVFIAQKGDRIPMAQAVALGLVKVADVKARKADAVENKAVKPAAAATKAAKPSKE